MWPTMMVVAVNSQAKALGITEGLILKRICFRDVSPQATEDLFKQHLKTLISEAADYTPAAVWLNNVEFENPQALNDMQKFEMNVEPVPAVVSSIWKRVMGPIRAFDKKFKKVGCCRYRSQRSLCASTD